MSEAEYLASLFDPLRNGGKKINRSKFARDNHVPGGGSMIYQHIQGLKPISLDAAVAYCHGFQISLRDLSPRLAGVLEKLPRDKFVCASPPAATEPPAAYNVTPLPIKSNPLLEQLVATAAQLSPAGLERLVGYAEGLLGQYPQAKQNHVN